MKKMTNTVHLEGALYEHKIKLRTTGEKAKNPGQEYYSGIISLAISEDKTNVVNVKFDFVSATYASGKKNSNFALLRDIVDGKLKTVVKDGDKSSFFRYDGEFKDNRWYDAKKEEMVGSIMVSGGFLHEQDAGERKYDSLFNVDMLINNITFKEGTEDYGAKTLIKGYIFDYQKNIVPTTLQSVQEKVMNYFEKQEIDVKTPMFTKVWGKFVSHSTQKTVEEEGVFETQVTVINGKTMRGYEITNIASQSYEWDSEGTLLASEVIKSLQDRENDLALKKANAISYAAKKINTTQTSVESADNKKAGFDF